ncbi:homoserine kinase [Friedmanniella endophytica]|uniref:Homoserine kinase n=1 Tax=Microlunatus kandeliicorticis TaxID=1759536 RepID=A0A7W3IUL5_9ACTN|nr:homoserine kinase [Microlunatus kandeliicorticis]MBA8795558.1 homoserine kinase [Microlunatus kandeliicorticis]
MSSEPGPLAVGELEPGRRAVVEVPATSANLGPGFDAFGLALDWRDRCTFEVVPGGWSAVVDGEGAAAVPVDETHLVLATARRALDLLGVRVPGLRLTATNTIPHGRGLGSSSAAIVAGLLGAAALAGADTRPERWIGPADAIEGHPDNVAAALWGGFTLCYRGTDRGAGPVQVVGPSVHPDVAARLYVPATPVSTAAARGLLPPTVPHPDAAANAARAALLVEALGRRPDLLLAATEDRLHQHYRSAAMPASAALLAALRVRGCAAVISGAGPTVLVLGTAEQLARSAAVDSTGFRTVDVAVGRDATVVEVV